MYRLAPPLSVLVAVCFPGRALAQSITLPAPTVVTAPFTTSYAYDTYVAPYSAGSEIWVRTDFDLTSASDCAVTTVAGETFTWQSARFLKLTLPSGTTGLHTLSCTGASTTRAFYVVSTSPHEQVWFGRETPNSLAVKYNLHSPSLGLYTNGYAYDPTEGDPWVRRAGWWYLLNVAMPTYDQSATVYDCNGDGDTTDSVDGPRGVPKQSDGTYACGTADSPLARAATGSAPNPLLRLALAYLVADEYAYLYPTSTDNFRTNAAAYGDAAAYWGTTLASIGVTSAEWTGMSDIERSDYIQALAIAYDWMYASLDNDERHAWLSGLAMLTNDYYNDPANDLTSGDPSHWSALTPLVRRRALLNGHTWERNSAVAIVSLALTHELCTTTVTTGCSSNHVWLYHWWDNPWDTIGQIEANLPADGADHNGVYYWAANSRGLFDYYEALGTVPNPPAGAAAWANDWAQENPIWLDHMTHPNGHRVGFGDSQTYTHEGPSWQMGLVADEHRVSPYSSDERLPQYLAWEGHSSWAPGVAPGRRDVRDILFFDEDDTAFERLSESEHDARYTHACFPSRGQVSLRTGWTSNDGHFAYVGGPIIGGHDDPAVGSFAWYYRGHMVTTDGDNQVAKRTAINSTLLVDGYGQHGDGVIEAEAVPEHATLDKNNARLMAYLDNKGTARTTAGGTMPVDVVTFGSDLRPLYTLASSSDVTGRASVTDVDALANRGVLLTLQRYVVWVEGNVMVFDRAISALASGDQPFRFDWLLQSAEFNFSGTGEAATRHTAAVQNGDSDSYFDYLSPTSSSVEVRFPGTGAVDCDGSSCTDGPVGPFNLYRPVPATIGLAPTPFALDAACTSTACAHAWVEPANMTGRLDVQVLDAGSTPLTVAFTPSLDGGTIIGQRLYRSNTAANASFLTLLRPYTSPYPLVGFTNAAVTNGRKVVLTLSSLSGRLATAMFTNPGVSSFTSSDGSSYETSGHYSVVVHKNGQQPEIYSAQLVNGSMLKHGNVLINTDDTVSIGITNGPDAIWGTVDVEEDGTPSTTVWVDDFGRAASPSGRYYAGNGPTYTTFTPTWTSSGWQFTAPSDGAFEIRYGAVESRPQSDCMP